VAIRKGCDYLVFGEYGQKHGKPSAKHWYYQCVAYLIIMSFAKLVVTLLLQLKLWDEVRDILLWTIPSPKLEVTLVVLVIPFFVNVFMFWITDNFLTMHRLENSKVNKAMAVVRDKLNFKVPPALNCLRRAVDDDDTNLVEVTFDNHSQSMTTAT
jgi:hypothetical protein